MSTKEIKLPSWFNGELYEEGEDVTNPFSGESIYLNNIELSIYDFIMGATIVLEAGIYSDKDHKKLQNDFDKGLRWFMKNNSKAYMILLD